MIDARHRPMATILSFAAAAASRAARDGGRAAERGSSRPVVVTDSWYHQAAVDAERARKE